MVKFTLNGGAVSTDADPEMPLLWYLRDLAGLPGTKYGCGIGQCGACTVHLNGRAVRSCSVTLAALEGQSVTTIEGLSEDGDHPVQRAWMDMDVPQCGYCQVGQIMATVDLLHRIPKPTDKDIDREMTNLCRCGTYTRIRKAIHLAAQLTQESTS